MARGIFRLDVRQGASSIVHCTVSRLVFAAAAAAQVAVQVQVVVVVVSFISNTNCYSLLNCAFRSVNRKLKMKAAILILVSYLAVGRSFYIPFDPFAYKSRYSSSSSSVPPASPYPLSWLVLDGLQSPSAPSLAGFKTLPDVDAYGDVRSRTAAEAPTVFYVPASVNGAFGSSLTVNSQPYVPFISVVGASSAENSIEVGDENNSPVSYVRFPAYPAAYWAYPHYHYPGVFYY